MKGSELLIALLLIGILSFILYKGCNNEHKKQNWVITGKEFQQGGMCCDNKRQKKFYAVVIVAHNPHRHHYEPSKFIIHIGKPYSHEHFETDSFSFFTKYRVAQKILY